MDEDLSKSNEDKILTSGRTEDSRLAAEDEEKQETSRNEEQVEKQPNKLEMTVQSQVYRETENTYFSQKTTHPQPQTLVSIYSWKDVGVADSM